MNLIIFKVGDNVCLRMSPKRMGVVLEVTPAIGTKHNQRVRVQWEDGTKTYTNMQLKRAKTPSSSGH